MAAEGEPVYLFARVTGSGAAFYPQVHPVAEARLERGLRILWEALEELSKILGGGPAGFTLETSKAIVSGYSGPDGIVIVASPKKWKVAEVNEDLAVEAHAV